MSAHQKQTWAQRGSLRRKILLVVMTATCAALLLSATALLAYEIQRSRRAGVADLKSQADLIAQSLRPALAFDDQKAANDALAAFKLRPQIEVAALFNADGRLFASYLSADAAARAIAVPAQAERLGLRFEGTRLELTHAINQDGQALGVMYLRASQDLTQRVIDYLIILALAGFAGLGLAALVFRRLHPAITQPIVAMAEVSQRIIDDRDYALRVHASSDDEIGVLVKAFNNMLDDLSVQMKERGDAEEALRTADRRKDEFLATLAHELRNPLAPISAALALLKRNDNDPQMRQRMREMMGRQLQQMVRLIDDLLEVSRITRGKLELRREVVAVGDLVRQAVEASESTLSKKHHALTVHIPDEPVWVHADGARLIQVLVNLLNNASKYTPVNGRVDLVVQAVAGQVSILVRDNGIGIAPAQQSEVFDMFIQVDTSLERGAAGLGIGLTIARELVRLHDGSLSLHSDGLGKGATFTVLLPTVGAPTPVAAATSPKSEPGAARLNILVADDNVDFAESFAEILRQRGHRVVVAHDGRSALLALESLHPAVAFLDIGMPELNGLALASQLRARPQTKAIQLIAVTGWGQETDRQRVREAGFDHHLVKPIDFEQAMALIGPAGAAP